MSGNGLNCQCICPSAEFPTPYILQWDDPGPIVNIQLYGTLGFSASILTQAYYPNVVPQVPVIASVAVYGSTLQVIFTAPPLPEAGVYDMVVQVCNACGSVDIPIRLEVVQPVVQPTGDCALAQATFLPVGPIDVGTDQVLAFRNGTDCVTVTLPPAVDVCATLAAFPELALQPATDRVVGVDALNNCKLIAALDFLQGLNICTQIEALINDPLQAGDQLVAFRPGAPNLCVRGDAFDMVCAANVALAPLAGSPTTLFVATDVGPTCGTIDIATLAGLLPPFGGGAVANPILAADGSCAAPSYSFQNDTASGLWLDPGTSVTLSWNNCASRIDVGDIIHIEAANGDFIDVGASINLATAGELQLNGSPGTAGQGIVSQGPGLPPVWGAASGSSRLDQVTGATANASPIHGDRSVNWQWQKTTPAFAFRFSEAVASVGGAGLNQPLLLVSTLANSTAAPFAVLTGVGGTNQYQLSISRASTAVGYDVNIAGGDSLAGTAGDLILTGGTSGGGPPHGAIQLNVNGGSVVLNGDGSLDVNGSPGALGEVLTSQGPGVPVQWAPAGGPFFFSYTTAGVHMLVVPAGVTKILAQGSAAGGGGGGGTVALAGGGGAAGVELNWQEFTVVPGETLTINVGAGGAAGGAGLGGSAGGLTDCTGSSSGLLFSLIGGNGGLAPVGGNAGNGGINAPDHRTGYPGLGSSNGVGGFTVAFGGPGGSNSVGGTGGKRPNFGALVGLPGFRGGGGGGACADTVSPAAAGGAGGDGFVEIMYQT